MPEIGDISIEASGARRIWAACKGCGQERWTDRYIPREYGLCCNGKIKNGERYTVTWTPSSERNPVVGDITRGASIGKNARHSFILNACEDCGAERWVALTKAVKFRRCIQCQSRIAGKATGSGPNSRMWKSGKHIGPDGYVRAWISPEDPLAEMRRSGGYVLEHRLVMARMLGRPLSKGENVHHLNGIRDDNRPENLELWKRKQPHGIRSRDYHCPGCRCVLD